MHKSHDAARDELDRALRLMRDALVMWWCGKGQVSCLRSFEDAVKKLTRDDTNHDNASAFHGALFQMTALVHAGGIFAPKEEKLFGRKLSDEEWDCVFQGYRQIADLKIIEEKKVVILWKKCIFLPYHHTIYFLFDDDFYPAAFLRALP